MVLNLGIIQLVKPSEFLKLHLAIVEQKRQDIWPGGYKLSFTLLINQVSYDHFKSAVQYMKHFIYHFTSIYSLILPNPAVFDYVMVLAAYIISPSYILIGQEPMVDLMVKSFLVWLSCQEKTHLTITCIIFS